MDAGRSVAGSKLLRPLLLAKHGASVLEPGGSIVFTSGIAAAAALAAVADRLPVGRIGRTQDIAAAIIAPLRNGFITGTVLPADGGHRLV